MRLKKEADGSFHIISVSTKQDLLCPESGFTWFCGSQCPFFALNEDFNRVTLSCKDCRLFIPLEKEATIEKAKLITISGGAKEG